MAEKYILFSLEDEKTKKIAEVLANKTCKRILDILSEKELTENEIAIELKLPINTIEYNLKNLMQVGLIEQKSHFWSVKGKKMPVYHVSNKHIVISPKSSSRLKSFIPVVLISGAAAFLLKIFTSTQFLARRSIENTGKLFETSKETLVANMPSATDSSQNIITSIINNNWLWFLIGSLFAAGIFLILNFKKMKGG